MKRFLKFSAVALLVLIVFVSLTLYLALNRAAKTAVLTILPRMTKAPAALKTVDISLLGGKGTLSGFVLGNPPGYKTESAFSLDTVNVDVKVLSLLYDTVVIEDIIIDGPRVTYEMGSPSNIGAIQKNVEEYAGMSKKGQDGKTGKKLIINHFLMRNGAVSLSATFLQGQSLTVPLPTIEMRDIGKDSGGKAVGDVMDEVYRKIAGAVEGTAMEGLSKAKDSIGEATKGVVDTGKKVVRDAVDGLKEFFGGGRDDKKK